jgi:hypothetical protein
MGEAHGLNQVSICAKSKRNAFGNLGYFKRMSEARTEEISLIHPKDLGFALESAKGSRMDDPCPITFKL